MSKCILIAGLAFGDEGKGTITQYFADDLKAELVVRYNGGAQAAHNVVSVDGRRHTFSQFGSATLEGVKTYLSKHMLVEPHALMAEGRGLSRLGISSPYSLLTIDRDALLITPYHWSANRLRELSRSFDAKHGTCGMGIGETMSDYIRYGTSVSPVVGDLQDLPLLSKKFKYIQEQKREEFKNTAPDSIVVRRALAKFEEPIDHVIDRYRGYAELLNIGDAGCLEAALRRGTVIFEGAQGALLDQDFGFHPHTTWTDTTFRNADNLLSSAGFSGERRRVGVMRTYMTRHGVGPLPTETRVSETLDPNNGSNLWQGLFRVGNPDPILIDYALRILGGVDEIALTHADQLSSFHHICTGYRHGSVNDIVLKLPAQWPADYQYQEKLAALLSSAVPMYSPIPSLLSSFLEQLSTILETPIRTLSVGPGLLDKTKLP